LANSIELENVEAAYGAVRVLDHVTMTVNAGETVALLGTNGNGKSTLMKCIMGIVPPSAGPYRGGDRRRSARPGRPFDRGDRRSRYRARAGRAVACSRA